MVDEVREFSRWRVDHARDPDTDTTPLAEAAQRAGQRSFQIRLGEAGLKRLRNASECSPPQLSEESLNEFGRAVAECVDEDDVPSRLEIAQTLLEQAGEPDDMEDRLEIQSNVGDRWREALVQQCAVEDLQRFACAAADETA